MKLHPGLKGPMQSAGKTDFFKLALLNASKGAATWRAAWASHRLAALYVDVNSEIAVGRGHGYDQHFKHEGLEQ